jgi:DnaJ-like protein
VRNEQQSLYAILGVDRDAKPHDIERAYRRIKAEMQKETTPPDPRRRALVEHAHDVLMDPARREAYDTEQRSPQAKLARVQRSPMSVALVVAALAAIATGAWFATRSPSAPAKHAKPKQDVENAVSVAVGRVHRIELSGETAPLGLAFAIDEGTLVTSCEGVSPNAEMFVKFGPRRAPVRVSAVDEATGLCKLTGGSVGSWPLEAARLDPLPAELAYVVSVGPSGDAHLAETHVKNVVRAAGSKAFEVDAPIDAQALGGPLVDVEARVVAAASRVGGRPLYVHVPEAWRHGDVAPRPAATPR